VPVAGIYSGSLNEDGERITVAASLGDVLSSFTYATAQPWPAKDANAAYTLVLSHPELGLDSPAAWRASVDTGGSPGGTDATEFAGTPSADVDGDGWPALLEYALGTSDIDPTSGPGALTPGFDALGISRSLFRGTSVPTTSPWLSRPLRTYSPGFEAG